MTVAQTHHLPLHERVLVDKHFEVTGQPSGNAGTLFNRFCRDVGADFKMFPIDLLDWKKVSDHKRDRAWNNIVKVRIDYSISVV